MANTRISIEELESSRWHAEIEVGGGTARRVNVNAASLGDIMVAVAQKHAELSPAPVARSEREIAADQAAVGKKMVEIEAEADRAVRDAERIADDAALARTDAQARAKQESERLALEVEGIKARERAEHAEVPRAPAPGPLNSSEAKVDDARQSGGGPLPPAPGVDHVGGMRQREIDAPPSQPTTDMRPTAAEAAQRPATDGVIPDAKRVEMTLGQAMSDEAERKVSVGAATQRSTQADPKVPLTPAETKRMETLRAKRESDRTPAERLDLRELARRAG